MNKKVYFVHFFLFFTIAFSQKNIFREYEELSKKYENYKDSDTRALPYVNLYIAKAKKEKNYPELFQGYKDAVMYSNTKEQKLKYADSTITVAKLSGNENLISIAYLGKGVVYYYNYKKFQQALDEYIKAYQYSENSKDQYFKTKILYHIGLVKTYLGYYEDALKIFEKCGIYFKSKIDANLHPNEVFNNTKGYYNTLHQMAICNRNLKNYTKADSLIELGLRYTAINDDLLLEHSYFLKCKGMSEYHHKNYESAIKMLKLALPEIIRNGDFTWEPFIYFYIGKCYLALNNEKEAVANFQKVDILFNNYQFILPEIRENYELLIRYYQNQSDHKQQLYYTTQLLKVSDVIDRDFAYLSPKIHKEYDTHTLQNEKIKLEEANFRGLSLNIGLGILAVSLVIFLGVYYRREKKIRYQYLLLEKKIMTKETSKQTICLQSTNNKKSGLSLEKTQNILNKLEMFEEKKEFTQRGLTVHKLAQQFNTNYKYLSWVINKYKGKNFTKYLNELRIEYITWLLFNDKKYLDYKVESLSEECGIAARQNFSDLFYEINGLRPTDFIRKRKAELQANLKSQATIKSA